MIYEQRRLGFIPLGRKKPLELEKKICSPTLPQRSPEDAAWGIIAQHAKAESSDTLAIIERSYVSKTRYLHIDVNEKKVGTLTGKEINKAKLKVSGKPLTKIIWRNY